MTFEETLLSALAPFHLLSHPFYVAWMKGELSRAQLRAYATQYHPHVEAFPRYISGTHNLCEDPAARRELASNLADEEGLAHGSTPHPELWLDFCEGLGLSRDEVVNAPTKPAARALRDGFHRLCRSSYAEGLGALIAYEYQVPEIAKSKIEGLKTNYAIDDAKTLEFFRVHEEADVFHSQACGNAFDALSETDRPVATDAAIEASRLLWDFLSEAMHTLRVRDLSVQVHLGCMPAERERAQEVRFSFEFRFPARPRACVTDKLSDTFCYAETCGVVKRVARSRHFDTIEALTHETREAVRTLLPMGMTGWIRIHKVRPPVDDLLGGVDYEESLESESDDSPDPTGNSFSKR